MSRMVLVWGACVLLVVAIYMVAYLEIHHWHPSAYLLPAANLRYYYYSNSDSVDTVFYYVFCPARKLEYQLKIGNYPLKHVGDVNRDTYPFDP